MDTATARKELDDAQSHLRSILEDTKLSRAEHKIVDEAITDFRIAADDYAETLRRTGGREVWYMAHPVGGDVDANLARAKRWLRFLRHKFTDVTIIAPWIASIAAGEDDADPIQRERGLLDCEATVSRCDALVLVGGLISNGMKREALVAQRLGLVVHDWSGMGTEPPPPFDHGSKGDAWTSAIAAAAAGTVAP